VSEPADRVDEIDTPALVVDLDAMERNVERIAGRCREFGLGWRPHTKGLKVPAIARRCIQARAIGITCAKVGDAEWFVDGGLDHLLIANQVIGDSKLDRVARLRQRGVDVIFAPARDEMYPPGFATWVEPEGAARGLEADHRPGHFRGVATVCLKLFNIVRPHRAYFGRKDAQQVAVLKQLVDDLHLELEIRVVPTVRDADGLALSSRNDRLSAEERARALAIPRALETRDPERARELLEEAGLEVDYVVVADLDGPTLAVAARVGSVRLIDNVLLEGDPE
jgi:pantoate--beta-alanine ligase